MSPAPLVDSTITEEHLASLLDINATLTGATSLRSGLRRVLEILARQYGMIRSSVTFLSSDAAQLSTEATYGFSADGPRAKYRIGEGITGQVVESCKPVIIPQVSLEP